jgi:hypothetical protein
MSRKPTVVLPLATALASLMGAGTAVDSAKAALPDDRETLASPDSIPITELKANSFFAAGDELLSFVTTEREDGTIIAQHVSHESHASHASHASHYSGR